MRKGITIGKDVYIAPTASIIGKVEVGDRCVILDSAVIRGDQNRIVIGPESNVQDNATIHADLGNEAVIGKGVSIGHNAIVHGAFIGDHVLVGMGSIVMNGSRIGSGSVVGAGAVVTEDFTCNENSLVLGLPAKVIRMEDTNRQRAILNAISYQELRKNLTKGVYERYVHHQ
ncbi:MAG: gamma carbonic anhydrase family protein [Candidatus Thermoplasmatota archaeon]|jgi:carbonic anhydrase/acetyltransferase-like protein (isoleucine patch superfamily)|nr:gamma carbonic anhydrase family protein [Candidatus Thermoplasmatota archaeon]MCL5785096.1 gamma carbonic anhydrase family protein [Candidatus Thermoplasmatota archaeon]